MAIQKTASGTSYTFPLKSLLLPKKSIKKSFKRFGQQNCVWECIWPIFNKTLYVFLCKQRKWNGLFFSIKMIYSTTTLKCCFLYATISFQFFLTSKSLANTTQLDKILRSSFLSKFKPLLLSYAKVCNQNQPVMKSSLFESAKFAYAKVNFNPGRLKTFAVIVVRQ